MLVAVVEQDRIRYESYSERIRLPVLSEETVISQKNGKGAIVSCGRLKPLIYHSASEDEKAVLSDQRTGRTASLYFTESEGTDRFRQICFDRRLTIGNSIEDDLFIRSEWMIPHGIVLDPSDMSVTIDQRIPVSLNGRRVLDKVNFKENDCLQCFQLTVILHRRFLVINEPRSLVCILPQPDIAVSHCFSVREPIVLQRTGQVCAVPIWKREKELEMYRRYAVRKQKPVFYTIGPVLMMASASLLCGIMMYMQSPGKGSLAVVILPAVMMLSALLFTPLSAGYERRENEEEIRKAETEYLHYLEKMCMEMEEERNRYSGEIDKLFPDSAVFCMDQSQTSTMYFRAGKAKGLLHMSIASELPQDAVFSETVSRLKEKEQDHQYRSCILDLMQCRTLSMEDFTDEMVLAVLNHLHASGIHAVLEAEERELYSLRAFLNHPVFFAADGSRLIAEDREKACKAVRDRNDEMNYVIVSFSEQSNLNPTASIPVIVFAHADAAIQIRKSGDSYEIQNIQTSETYPFLPDQSDSLCAMSESIGIVNEESGTFLSCMNADQAEDLNIGMRWSEHEQDDHLSAAIGRGTDHHLICVDLSESGDGPHGLIAGSTGSGKSELLTTLVLSLAVEYSPEQLQFVLIDFKGGGISSAFANSAQRLPHVINTLTNLDDDHIQRAVHAFANECIRREQLFLKNGTEYGMPVRNLSDYRKLRAYHPELEQISELVVIVDEFAELKANVPEFLKQLISVARIGRSLGIHLILATQKPAGSISDEIRSNIRYRICLRTSERNDSMEVLHIPDAADLKRPGEFILQVDGSVRKGRCAYANASAEERNPTFILLDEKRMPLYRSRNREAAMETELQQVIRCICMEAECVQGDHSLWRAPLDTVAVQDIEAVPFCIGYLDDLHHCVHRKMILPDDYGVSAFFTLDSRRMHALLRTLVFALRRVGQNVVIAAENGDYEAECIAECTGSSLIKEEYSKMKPSMMRGKALIIMKADVLKDTEPGNSEWLDGIFRECNEQRIKVYLIASSLSSFRYQQQSCIRHRYVLSDFSMKEAAVILEQRPEIEAYSEEGGYCTLTKTGIFRFAAVSLCDLAEMQERNLI